MTSKNGPIVCGHWRRRNIIKGKNKTSIFVNYCGTRTTAHAHHAIQRKHFEKQTAARVLVDIVVSEVVTFYLQLSL